MTVGSPAWRPSRIDVALAVAVAVAGVVESVGRAGDGPGRIAVPAAVAAGAVAAGVLLLFRRRFPVTMLLLLTALGIALRAVMDANYPLAAWQTYSTLILAHTVGSAAPLRPGWRGAAGPAAVAVAYVWLQAVPGTDLAERLIMAVFVGVAYASGVLLRRQTERAERARRAAADERTRIARELHDIVSHTVGVMTLRAGGVRLLLDGDDARARERDLLAGVEASGREAIDELRLMLGILRTDGDGFGFGFGGERLETLADGVRATGIDVRISVDGDPVPLPAAVGLSAYRIVQEALTNVVKHARATTVSVAVTYAPGELRLSIVDDGAGSPPREPQLTPSGHGLAGMRERAASHGGELTAGPRPGRGYAVTATLPLGEPDHSSSVMRSIRSPMDPDPAR